MYGQISASGVNPPLNHSQYILQLRPLFHLGYLTAGCVILGRYHSVFTGIETNHKIQLQFFNYNNFISGVTWWPDRAFNLLLIIIMAPWPLRKSGQNCMVSVSGKEKKYTCWLSEILAIIKRFCKKKKNPNLLERWREKAWMSTFFSACRRTHRP